MVYMSCEQESDCEKTKLQVTTILFCLISNFKSQRVELYMVFILNLPTTLEIMHLVHHLFNQYNTKLLVF